MEQGRPPEDGPPPPPDEGNPAGDGPPEEDGPPPPPPLADRTPASAAPAASEGAPTRRANRRWPLVLALVVVLIGVPAGLYLLGALDDGTDGDTAAAPEDLPDAGDDGSDGGGPDAEPGPDGDPDPDAEPDPDGDPGPDAPGSGPDAPGSGPDDVLPVDPLDLGPLEGTDLLWGQLLTDIDAAEREMIAFQDDLAAAFGGEPSGTDDPLDAAAEVAANGREALLEVRARLAGELDDAAADEVRERYVAHLDAWASFMAEVEEDPLVVLEQSERGFTVDINATADAFARALEAQLPGDVDAEVERFAEGILDRGFRGFGTAQV